MAERHSTDSGVVKAWIENSHHRKCWPVKTLKSAQSYKKDAVIAIWGLAYKENTHSTKNSPALVALSQLCEHRLRVYDPIVKFDPMWHSNASVCISAHEALSGADVLLLMTPWPEFRDARNQKIISECRPSIIVDPYNLTSNEFAAKEYFTLGRAE
jgi:UDPglucose 6-dehydrogenase